LAGQRPQKTRARKSVSAFRLREGMEIGCRVTLRGKLMYEFLDRLITLALPRVRDFRGLNPRSFDGRGNYSMGLNEQLVFPEINADKVHERPGNEHFGRHHRPPTMTKRGSCLRELGLPLRVGGLTACGRGNEFHRGQTGDDVGVQTESREWPAKRKSKKRNASQSSARASNIAARCAAARAPFTASSSSAGSASASCATKGVVPGARKASW
jgi:hypothetical protein